jgi:hypothetical protein
VKSEQPVSVELPAAMPDVERLTGLVFELASQLHAERARRIALEQTLAEAGALPDGWEASFQADERYSERCQAALDDAMARMMQIMAESTDPRTPLRREAAAFDGASGRDSGGKAG